MKPFVHKDTSGLRIRITYLTHQNGEKPEIVLLPMVHAADKIFYDEILKERRHCNVVIFEAASMVIGKHLKWLYNFMRRSKRMKLTMQSDVMWGRKKRKVKNREKPQVWARPTPDAALETIVNIHDPYACECGRCVVSRHVRFIKADLDDDQTRNSLKKLPFWVWPLLPLIAICGGIYILFCGSRKDMISGLTDPSSSLEEALEEPESPYGIFSKYVLTDRETVLFKTIRTEIDRIDNAGKLIGIEYGAAHMERVKNVLLECGYDCDEQRSVLCVAHEPAEEMSVKEKRYERLKAGFRRRAKKPVFKTGEEEKVDELIFVKSVTDDQVIISVEPKRIPVTSYRYRKDFAGVLNGTGALNTKTSLNFVEFERAIDF